MSNGRAIFTPEHRPSPGARPKPVQVVRCHECPATHEFAVNTATRGGMSDETIIRKATVLGWKAHRKGRRMTCPACDRRAGTLAMVHKLRVAPEEIAALVEQAEGAPLNPAALQGAIDRVRVEAVLSEGSATLDQLERVIVETGAAALYDSHPWKLKERPVMKPVPPPAGVREPSRDDKRRILEALSARYVSEEVGYSGDWTDDKLAASLSVPMAWVRDLRVEFHGENAGNEALDGAARERKRAINECRTDIRRIETKLTEDFARAERELSVVRGRLDRLDGGAS